MVKIIVDGENAIVGRMGTFVAKELLKKNEVLIVNSEKAIVSGNRKGIVEKIQAKRRMGRGSSLKGPKISKLPDRMLKRMIRGMLPRDRTSGREAFKRLRCVNGNNLKEDELKTLKKLNHKKPLKYLTIKRISELI